METSDPRSVQWQLPAALLDALEHQAGTEGLPAERIAARVLEAGLTELGLMPNGRCSVRTGLCGSGPVPLPVQQNSGAGAVT
jgi:hypothetical protein